MAKSSRWALVLLLCLLPYSLLSDVKVPFRIGIVALSPGSESLQTMVADVLRTYQDVFVLHEEQRNAVREKEQMQRQLSWEKELYNAYRGPDERRIKQLTAQSIPSIESFTSFSVQYEEISYNKELASAFLHDTQAMDWYISKHNLDSLILLEVISFDDFQRVIISNYERYFLEPEILFDKLVQHSFFRSMRGQLEETLFRFSAKGEWSAVLIKRSLAGLEVFIEGKRQPLHQDLLFLKPGEYNLLLSAVSHANKEIAISLEGNSLLVLDPSLERIPQKSLTLISNQGLVQWSKKGTLLDQGLSITLSDPQYPLVLTVSKQGFQERILHIDAPVSKSLSVTMQINEMASNTLLLSVQKDFYKRLRNTILLFGAYVGCTALSQTFDKANPMWQIGLVTSSSAALVSLTALIFELTSYANLATDGASYK